MIGRNMKKGASALELAKTIKTVRLDGNSLTLDELVAVARYNAAVELTNTALDALRRSLALADKIAHLRHHHRLRRFCHGRGAGGNERKAFE